MQLTAQPMSLTLPIAALSLTAIGMAAGTAMQAVSYYSANIGSFLLGGLSLRPPSTKPGLSGRLSHSGHSLRCNSSLVLAITERRENKCQTIATDSASEAGSNSV